MESAGFGLKDWAIVCEAMGCGQQCVIVRKGGIAEGRNGFAFRYPEFFLFPTFFHEQSRNVRIASPEQLEERPGEIADPFFRETRCGKDGYVVGYGVGFGTVARVATVRRAGAFRLRQISGAACGVSSSVPAQPTMDAS
jgi:hypothetical protein